MMQLGATENGEAFNSTRDLADQGSTARWQTRSVIHEASPSEGSCRKKEGWLVVLPWAAAVRLPVGATAPAAKSNARLPRKVIFVTRCRPLSCARGGCPPCAGRAFASRFAKLLYVEARLVDTSLTRTRLELPRANENHWWGFVTCTIRRSFLNPPLPTFS